MDKKEKRSFPIGTWKMPGAPGAYKDAPVRGAPVETGQRRKGKRES